MLHAAAAAVVLAVAVAAPADTVTTKSGETFTGTIVEKTAEHVVLKTISGKVTIPMTTVETIEEGGPAPGTETPAEPDKPDKPPPKIVPVDVEPAKADEAFQEARSALVAGNWVKAGGLLEGLMRVDEKHFSSEKRLGATGALITCYLQIKDAHGASRAIGRRASLAPGENDKKRLVAASEMLRDLGTLKVGEKTLGRFEEVIEAAMPWKAERLLEKAADLARNASNLNNPTQLGKAADNALDLLGEANVYVPGYADAHRTEVLAELVNNILKGARDAVDYCKKIRPELTRTRLASIASKPAAIQWNSVARVYLGRRQAAEDALNLLKSFTLRYKVEGLFEQNAAEVQQLLADLDEYQYYPAGSVSYGPYSPYYGTRTRMKIQLRTF
jgi:hypothetical protein